MNKLLNGLRGLATMLVCGDTEEEHAEKLTVSNKMIAVCGFRVRINKFSLVKPERYLGSLLTGMAEG